MTANKYRYLLHGIGWVCLIALLAALFGGRPVLAASDRYVAPAGSDTTDCSNNATPCLTIAYAVAQAAAGDTVYLAAGTYNGPGNQHVVVDKALTLIGAGAATTVWQYDPLTIWTQGGRNGVLEIRAGDVTISDLTIRDAPVEDGVPVWGVRVWRSGFTLANITFDTVHFLNNAGRGLELHNDTTIVNLIVRDCLFDSNGGQGIRSASTTRIQGFEITGTTFRDNGHSGYQQSAGSGYLSGLRLSTSTFENNALLGVGLSNVYDAIVETSSFSGGGKGIALVETMAIAEPLGAVTIRDNTMTDLGGAAVLVDITNEALGAPLTIEGNTIAQAANLLTGGVVFDIGLTGVESHAAVTIDDNAITLSGPLGALPAVHALKLSGGLTHVAVTANQFDGGGVGNNGGGPATSGIYLASTSAKFGSIDAGDSVEISTNTITGFVNGISVYDEAGADFGGLPAANGLSIVRNSIAGNSTFGVRSGPANNAAAICNWWGSPSGPDGAGPGTGDAVSSHVLFAPWLPSNDLTGGLCGGVNDLFVGTNRGGTVGGVTFGDVDILALDRDSGTWSKFFEGRDVNVTTNLTGFTFDPGDNCLLISFDGNEKKLGLGIIKPNDILKFCPSSLGATTIGTWSVYFDGSDVGLAAKSENLDALELLPDGRLLLSTKGNFSVKNATNNTVTGRDEDILIFDPTTLGPNTTGSFERYLDGSDVPGLDKEDVTGIYYNPLNGDLHISIQGKFVVGGVAGDSSDIIILRPNGSGYLVLPYWHGPDDGWTYVTRSMHIDLP
jgi:hypothetical protein